LHEVIGLPSFHLLLARHEILPTNAPPGPGAPISVHRVVPWMGDEAFGVRPDGLHRVPRSPSRCGSWLRVFQEPTGSRLVRDPASRQNPVSVTKPYPADRASAMI
jgi:hypothetical protein